MMKERLKKLLLFLIIVGAIGGFFYYKYIKDVNYDVNLYKTDKHYINELYRSDDRIYNNYLTDKEKKMYDFIVSKARKFSPSIKINMDDFACKDYEECGSLVDKATDAILVDHPEFLNFAGYHWSYVNNEFTLKITYSYVIPVKNYIGIKITEKTISEIKERTKNMSDKGKIIYVYEWMGKHNEYDRLFSGLSKNQSAYNVFVKHNAVCAGFAKASQLIFSNIGIESYIISGTTRDSHMWNIVKYDDKYYYFDSTVPTSIRKEHSSYYNGIKQDQMTNYHPSYSNWYPRVETTNMFEFKR